VKVLIVDDKKENLYLLESLLKGHGHEVIAAANGAEALTKLRGEVVDIIIADILMPVMDGFQLCKEVRADSSLQEIFFIFLTATYTDEKDEELAMMLGADLFLRKPLEPDELIGILQRTVQDLDAGAMRPREPGLEEGQEVFKLYSERLVKKLERKMLALDRELAERKRAEAARDWANRGLKTLYACNRALAHAADEADFMETICRIIVEIGGYPFAWIGFTEHDQTKSVRPVAHAGWNHGYLETLRITWAHDERGKGPAGTAIRTGAPAICKEISSDPELAPWREEAMQRGYASCIALPLITDGQAMGVLMIYWREPDGFDADEVKLLGELAGDLSYGITTLRTRDQRRIAEEALRESEAKYRELVQNANSVILRIDPRGNITFINEFAQSLFGYTRDEILGKNVIEAIFPEKDSSGHDLDELITDLLARPEKYFSNETENLGRNRQQVWINWTCKVIRDAQGNPIELLCIGNDITARKRLEGQLRQAQKLEAIGTLTAGIAHDFNNILSAVLGYAELARYRLPPDSPALDNLNQILHAGLRAKDLVKQILSFSRQSEEERRPVIIGPIVKEALKMLRASLPATIEIRSRIDNLTSTVMADPTQMHQILMNLSTNAFHAMRQTGGVLEVALSEVEPNASLRALNPDIHPGNYLQLTVKDSGPGMSPEIVERIFDPYFTTKEIGEGTGLGLSVVHGIVTSCGGIITVQSEPGKGSAFNVLLPAMEREMVTTTVEDEILPTGSGHIFLVDDDLSLVELGKQMLDRLGYRVTTRTSSLEALETFINQSDKFDLVITDMTMPHLTGTQLAEKILALRPDIPIILCTGYSELVDKEKAKRMGIRAFLMKPLVLRDLAVSIGSVLGRVSA
jgi:PAS domain S-box-containing protein